MSRRPKPAPAPLARLAKCPTGIDGLDVITGGGLPRGRPTLVCGGAGSGKTLIGMEFLIQGIQQHGENGAFLSFEERVTDLAENVASLGYDLTALTADKRLVIDQVRIERGEIMESGEYNLDGLFIRLAAAIDEVGAKRVVLDTIETLFAALTNTHIIRSELGRLFGWLKEKGVTAIITGERGDGTLTRHGLEEYVSDCVISLDQRVTEQIATRRLRVVKYRGSAHGTNEYPFLIDEQGITVLPITAIDLNYQASRDVVSTGIPKLDSMLGGEGYYRGGSLLVSGTAGTGKSSIAAHFADAACRRGEQCIYFAFEESPGQIVRNMHSIGIDLGNLVEKDLLHFAAFRPCAFGLEVHLSTMLKRIDEIKPRIVIVDPVSSFVAAGTDNDAKSMLMRMIDLLKARQITALMTSLTGGGHSAEQSEFGISSLIDSWVMLRNLEQAGERTRTLSIIKSRGMKHSNQARELVLSDHGVDLAEVFIGPAGDILTGSLRVAQETADRAAVAALEDETARKQTAMLRKRKLVEARIAEMEADIAAEADEVDAAIRIQASVASGRSTARAAQALEREHGGDLQTIRRDGGQL
jgi:circadian clock protein KaiC